MSPSSSLSHASRAIAPRRNDFDLVAPIYDPLATLVFCGAIRRSQVALLPHLAGARSAIVIGGGTGWFLLELLRRTNISQILYVEKSQRMLRRSRMLVKRKMPEAAARVEFRLGTEASLAESDGAFDVIVTNFFLDIFNDDNCVAVAQALDQCLVSDGRWLFVDFHTPPPGPARWFATVLFKVMFTFFNVLSHMESRRPPRYSAAFARLGLSPLVSRGFYANIIRAQLLEKRA